LAQIIKRQTSDEEDQNRKEVSFGRNPSAAEKQPVKQEISVKKSRIVSDDDVKM
jgi:hypothetical protein